MTWEVELIFQFFSYTSFHVLIFASIYVFVELFYVSCVRPRYYDTENDKTVATLAHNNCT